VSQATLHKAVEDCNRLAENSKNVEPGDVIPAMQPKPYWIERLPDGRKLFCFRVRRHGKYVIQKFTLDELVQILK
jgi:hypothetical protein